MYILCSICLKVDKNKITTNIKKDQDFGAELQIKRSKLQIIRKSTP